MPKARADALLRAAYQYFNAGFTPIPLQSGDNAKLPLLRSVEVDFGFETRELNRLYERGWGETPFTWERFDEMFRCAGGIGIAVGACSGGLAVVDFDDPAAHEIWIRENSEMAGRMPAVRTARGVHYYFVSSGHISGGWKSFSVAGYVGKAGELKLANGYVVAPPTRHPDGMLYEWVGPSILERRPPVIDLVELRLTVAAGFAAVEADQETDQKEQLVQGITGSLTLSGGASELTAEFDCWRQAVCFLRRHLPRTAGHRNHGLLALVRSLKTVPQLRPRPAAHFERLIAIWCEELEKLRFVRGTSFPQNWREFTCAWDRWSDQNADGFAGLFKHLDLAGLSRRDKVRAVCLCLSEHNEGRPFPLGSIALSQYLGVSQSQATRILRRLTCDGEILRVSTGRRYDWTANRYQIGPEFRWENQA